MAHYDIAKAKAQFAKLLRRALAGEEVVIVGDGKPLLRLIPIQAARCGPRWPSSAKGLIKTMVTDFDAPLDDFARYR